MASPPADKLPLTAAIITLNAGAQLDACLASVAFAGEILVVDSGSTDETLAIARARGARVVSHDWLGFGRQKQLAVQTASHDWVLSLDADERVSEPLAQSIRADRKSTRLNSSHRL